MQYRLNVKAGDSPFYRMELLGSLTVFNNEKKSYRWR
jgi:hypothetical protein